VSIAELRVKPGGWPGTGGRKTNKRATKFWPLLPRAAGNQASGRRVRAAASAPKVSISGMFFQLCRMLAWAVCILAMLMLLGAISLGLVHGYRSLTTSEHFAVGNVQISGNRQLSYAELLHVSGIAIGESILEVNLGEITARLLRSPWVESATVRRILPGGVSIHIVEREPFFWIQQEGVLYYADRLGRPIVPVELGRFVSLPALVVQGEAQPDTELMQEWMRAVESMEYPFGFPEVAWLRVEEANIVRMYLEDRGMEVTVDLGAWREHGRLLNRIWDDLRARGELERVGRLTVMAGKAWVQAKQS
jgi:cell division protein FtsQ